MLRSEWVPLYISEHKHTVIWNVTQTYILTPMGFWWK